ncbi:exo-alpha-sialidase [Arthrobacter sp. MMS18-M83]|uniref:exo-alpha-sialidase n=1 Tax=Arthrobacter sp. MMS18-M83 TaxID=2996261 RepID=UPI00227CF464|nr:exo-alpha-sialidase [Arthrobacter sp. MMS18-M83]WAH97386.1 hypothetical protein OW521_00295 [Arthrobacter sp. MMS18-M83]
MTTPPRLLSAVAACCLVLASLGTAPGEAAPATSTPATHLTWNSVQGPLTEDAEGGMPGTTRNPPSPICSTTGSPVVNVNTDCEGTAPRNETTIAVNPVNPRNLIGGVNDFQLSVSPGGTVHETGYSRAHVTFDGGATWTTSPIPDEDRYSSTGDPAIAFDAAGTAYYATLGLTSSQGKFCCTNPDVVVSHSSNGGQAWSAPAVVAAGSGIMTSAGIFNDKEYIAAWGTGNAIVTWTRFNLGLRGTFTSSPIFDSVTHDGGNTWSEPQQISGSAPFCVGAFSTPANTCNQNQFSVPVVAADGSIHVAFENLSNFATFRDQYLVVKVSPSTGALVAGPNKVADLVDGFTDYPIAFYGRQTLQDSEFRVNSAGNLVADPTNASHLAVVWSDMRNSTLPAPSDPYSAVTNADVVLSQSNDGGATWSAPVAINEPNDQFFPWAVYGADGLLRVGYFDRSYDPGNHKYGYTLATETAPGALSFTTHQVSTTLSDPTQGERWFSRTTVNAAFPHPTTFMGDYSGIADLPSGATAALWTDMRNTVCFTTRCGSGQDAFYGTSG